jgi:hypothetical protein
MDRHIERLQRASQAVLDQEQAQERAARLSQNSWTLQRHMYG